MTSISCGTRPESARRAKAMVADAIRPAAVTIKDAPNSSIHHVERWLRQMDTPYAELSEIEKESDRKEADRVLAVMRSAPPAAQPDIERIAREIAALWSIGEPRLRLLADIEAVLEMHFADASDIVRREVLRQNEEIDNDRLCIACIAVRVVTGAGWPPCC